MTPHPTRPGKRWDSERPDGLVVAEVKQAVDAVRTFRAALLDLAHAIGERRGVRGYLVLVDPAITAGRLREEWHRIEAILKQEVLSRLGVCTVAGDGRIRGIPKDPPADDLAWLEGVVRSAAAESSPRSVRPDYEFVVFKILLHQRLCRGEPVTVSSLAGAAGCSYPTVARVLKGLGCAVRRETDRRVSLGHFPHGEFARLLAGAEKARSTTRFVDASGQPRPPDAHLRRLEKLGVPGVGVGGVLGARHYFSGLDLVGAPRLDLSVHCGTVPLDVGFVGTLDPALEQQDDPRKPANVVLHAIRHADPLFRPREGGLFWADPVECLLDLHEARLEAQAAQFLSALKEGKGIVDGC